MISPYFGKLSTKHGYRSVLMGASGIMFFGALAYAAATTNTALIMAQILLGVGSGTLGVTRAYVADKSTKEQRTYLLAYTTCVFVHCDVNCCRLYGRFVMKGVKNILLYCCTEQARRQITCLPAEAQNLVPCGQNLISTS